MRPQRLMQIEDYIRKEKTVSLEAICREFNISLSTLRRDLKTITRNGSFAKVYGGITLGSETLRRPFVERHVDNPEAKRLIGRAAAALVADGDVIYIDSGTTTMYMADYLGERQNLTVLTHNFEVISRTLPHENITLVALGGALNRQVHSFFSESAVADLKRYNIAKAFTATAGISEKYGVTHSFLAEYSIKKAAVDHARQVILLADHSKIDRVATHTYCGLEDIDMLITDEPVPESFAAALSEHHCRLKIAGADGEQ
ncbi:MAG: DeoR/GlpR family DNA-binding transcription regulator [Methylobacteriaceae bacterium]|nr:DeoR/GlpR family DNA-binding transcription regulator [Methylobacteriaceae bacterium]